MLLLDSSDGTLYHLRCYLYQARDLMAMDKDSFSGEHTINDPNIAIIDISRFV